MVSEQAVKSKTEDPIQLFAMKLCLMQISEMTHASDTNATMSMQASNGFLDAPVVPDAQAVSPNKMPTLHNVVEDRQAVMQDLQAKLDQILHVVHEGSERCA